MEQRFFDAAQNIRGSLKHIAGISQAMTSSLASTGEWSVSYFDHGEVHLGASSSILLFLICDRRYSCRN
jgi:hypothetical protein